MQLCVELEICFRRQNELKKKSKPNIWRNFDFLLIFTKTFTTFYYYNSLHWEAFNFCWNVLNPTSLLTVVMVYCVCVLVPSVASTEMWNTLNASWKSPTRHSIVTGTRTQQNKIDANGKGARENDDKIFCRHNKFLMMKNYRETFEFNRNSFCHDDCMSHHLKQQPQ